MKDLITKNKIYTIHAFIIICVSFSLVKILSQTPSSNTTQFIKDAFNIEIKSEDKKNITKDETDNFHGDGKRFIYFYINPKNVEFYLQQKPFGVNWKKGKIPENCIDENSRCIESMDNFGVPNNYKKESIYYAAVKHYPTDVDYRETSDLQILILDPELGSLTVYSDQS